MKRFALLALALVLWLLLTMPSDVGLPEARNQDILVGLVVAFLVAMVMKQVSPGHFHYWRWIDPRRYFWGVIYLFVFTYYVLKANVDVAYRVLHPAMPIHPGIVKVKTQLKSPEARTALANSITLTPGTLTVDSTEDGYLYVHWINVKKKDVKGATERVIGRFEWFLKRILD